MKEINYLNTSVYNAKEISQRYKIKREYKIVSSRPNFQWTYKPTENVTVRARPVQL